MSTLKQTKYDHSFKLVSFLLIHFLIEYNSNTREKDVYNLPYNLIYILILSHPVHLSFKPGMCIYSVFFCPEWEFSVCWQRTDLIRSEVILACHSSAVWAGIVWDWGGGCGSCRASGLTADTAPRSPIRPNNRTTLTSSAFTAHRLTQPDYLWHKITGSEIIPSLTMKIMLLDCKILGQMLTSLKFDTKK